MPQDQKDALSIFTLLDRARTRPGMYVVDFDLKALEYQIRGYYWGLGTYGIIEPVPEMNRHFMTWLRVKTGWSTACGWADSLSTHCGNPEATFKQFFEFVDEYRRLVPIKVARADLESSGDENRPTRIELFRYEPTKLYFPVVYAPQPSLDWILMDGNGNYNLDCAAAIGLVTEQKGLPKDTKWDWVQ